jgi:hypothetical protein
MATESMRMLVATCLAFCAGQQPAMYYSCKLFCLDWFYVIHLLPRYMCLHACAAATARVLQPLHSSTLSGVGRTKTMALGGVRGDAACADAAVLNTDTMKWIVPQARVACCLLLYAALLGACAAPIKHFLSKNCFWAAQFHARRF